MQKIITVVLPIFVFFSIAGYSQPMDFPNDASHGGFEFSNWKWEGEVIFLEDLGNPATITRTAGIWDLISFQTTKFGVDGAFELVSDLDHSYTFSPNEMEGIQTHTLNWKGITTLTLTRTDPGETGNTSFDFDKVAYASINTRATKPVACTDGADGQAEILVGGGTAPFYVNGTSYLTNPFTVKNLSAGRHTFIVTDANERVTEDSVVITSAPTLSLTPTVTDVACKGGSTGSIDLEVSGGVVGAGYNYDWVLEDQETQNIGTTASLAELGVGTYLVTVSDANQCTITAKIPIFEPIGPITLTTSKAIPDCGNTNAGGAELVTTGGTRPYMYTWTAMNDNSFQSTEEDLTNVAADTYLVTVTDARNCTTNTSVEVAQINVTAAEDVDLCLGLSTTLTATGADAYVWSPTTGLSAANIANPIATPIETTLYTVTGTTDNGCEATATIMVTVDDLDTDENGIGDNCDCGSEETLDARVSEGNSLESGLYQARREVSSSAIIATGKDVTFKASETISLYPDFHAQPGSNFHAFIAPCLIVNTVIENNTIIEQTQLTIPTDISETPLTFKISPNPFIKDTKLSFRLPKEDLVSIRVFDQSGKLVSTPLIAQVRSAGDYQVNLTAAELQEGMFYAILQTSTERIVKKVIAIK